MSTEVGMETFDPINPVMPVSPVALSFKERLSQRRRELEANTTFELRVPGYEDLWARYRSLGFEEVRDIGLRVEKETTDQSMGERLTAAETLAVACTELLEYKGLDDQKQPIFVGLECRWSWMTARDLFEIDIPEGTTGREAVMRIFPYPRDMLMMTHFQDFLESSMGYLPEIEEILTGESLAPSGAK